MVACHVVTFADSRLSHMHRRFKRQAKKMGLFDSVWCWTERDLDKEFVTRFESKLTASIRGFGHFVWKPQVILQALQMVDVGDTLLYLDSGSHLVVSGRPRLLEYIEMVEKSKTGILAFELTMPESEWTKGDLLDFFKVRNSPLIVGTGQIQAGAIFVHRRPGVERLFLDWIDVFAKRFDLVDDTPSLSQNLDGFVAHRHDQSVFSLLAKKAGVTLLPASEQYPSSPGLQWKDLKQYPLHHRRDKLRKMQAIQGYLKYKREPVDLLLVRFKKMLLGK